ncbi:hypothetical protein GQ42DRAFT_160525 [Ramicandelaber brevisporus]|nr:hypothetical protein GQ42DRAFT_160525 [Ramicandelaber brevisporus]
MMTDDQQSPALQSVTNTCERLRRAIKQRTVHLLGDSQLPAATAAAAVTTAATAVADVNETAEDPLLLFLKLRHLNRDATVRLRRERDNALDARNKMDKLMVTLQNLVYERDHIVMEIQQSENLKTIYQNIELDDIHDIYAAEEAGEKAEAKRKRDDADTEHADNDGSKRQRREVPTDEHQILVERLQYELKERKRCETMRSALARKKTILQRLLQEKTASFDELSQRLSSIEELAARVGTELKSAIKKSSTPAPAPSKSSASAAATASASTATATAAVPGKPINQRDQSK